MTRFVFSKLGFLSALLASSACWGVEFEWKGFASALYSVSDNLIPTSDQINERGGLSDLSRAGLTTHAEFGRQWSATVQLVGNFRQSFSMPARIEWALVAYSPFESSLVRVGKQVLPAWMYSEYVNIGALLPWVRPPIEVYAMNPVTSFYGANWEQKLALTTDLHLTVSGFAGAIPVEVSNNGSIFRGLEESYVAGAAATVEVGNYLTLRGYYSWSRLNAEILTTSDTALPTVPPVSSRSTIVVPANLGTIHQISLGANLDWNSLLVLSEFSHFSSQSALLKSSTAAYGTLGYHLFDRKLLPRISYSSLFSHEGTLSPGLQTSVQAGLNYRVNESIVVKGEWQNTRTNGGKSNFLSDPGKPVNVFAAGVEAVF